ncbi:CocE/NonD family hydrolase [Streptomyces sp. 3213.3]|uniref:CocE/NonD family hydrolase n=1 Tax=Streptomyces sp. 3213.3 TaxID=1855348 RepID=UPI00190EB57F|nr:CocE/NonD family hydrolase [Streptomyces sp. 3213.3]
MTDTAAVEILADADADLPAFGHRSDYIQAILTHDVDDQYWTGLDHRDRVADVTVPVSSIGGWYDICLPGQIRDFTTLQAAGRPARLSIGPWTHTSVDNTVIRARQSSSVSPTHAAHSRRSAPW